MKNSAFCLVLHSHIPYVLHHGESPHGESWLLEAIYEVYLPLIRVLDNTKDLQYQITLGVTPILLTQLASKELQQKFDLYLESFPLINLV